MIVPKSSGWFNCAPISSRLAFASARNVISTINNALYGAATNAQGRSKSAIGLSASDGAGDLDTRPWWSGVDAYDAAQLRQLSWLVTLEKIGLSAEFTTRWLASEEVMPML